MKKEKKTAKPYVPPIRMNTKVAKFFVNKVLKGKPTTVAAREAGIRGATNFDKYKKLPTYQRLEKKYAQYLEERIGMAEVAEEHRKNIMQDQDKGAKNTAIKMFLERVEPEAQKIDEDEKMIVIFKPN